MTTGQTVNGYPYPNDDDDVRLGAQRIRALAERIEGITAQMANGVASVTFATVPGVTFALTFPAGRFTSPPNVIGIGRTSAGVFAYASGGLSTTGVTMTARSMTGGNLNATYSIDWVAVNRPA